MSNHLDHGRLESRILVSGTIILLTRLRIGGAGDEMDNRLPLLKIRSPNGQETVRVPIIPGSSLRGTVRSEFLKIARIFYGEKNGVTVTEELFGSEKQEYKGFIKFKDALLVSPASTSYQTSTGINPKTRTVKKGNIFAVEYLPPGTEFNFEMQVENVSTGSEKFKILKHVIVEMARGNLPVGGMKTRGMGLVKIRDMRMYHYKSGKQLLGLEQPSTVKLD